LSFELYVTIIFTLFGLLVGSFLNAVIYRFPRKISISAPRSRCPHCNKIINWYENIPIISYIFLKGKCSKCKNSIHWRYPVVELITAIVAFLIAPTDFGIASILNFTLFFSVYCSLFCHFLIDLEHKILPDQLNLYLAAIFLIHGVFNYTWQHWLLGSAVGFGVPYGVTWLFYLLRGEIGLGGGDVKLFAALGIYLGPFGIIQNIFFSCFLGSIFGIVLIATKVIDRKYKIPFGPFIIIVAALQIFFPALFKEISSLLFI
jgi:leader peptidase (prepilin peptidase)/N-methyltransferase